MSKILENIEALLNEYPFIYDNIKFVGVLILAYFVYLITKKVIFNGLRKIIRTTKTKYDDILLNEKILRRLAYIAPIIIINQFSFLINTGSVFIDRVTDALIVFFVLLAIITILTSLTDIIQSLPKFKERPIKGYGQVIKIIISVFGGIIILGLLTGENPWTILTGLGALTAIILLIFKDTILSFVASIQISSYDLVKVGDWIEVPKYGVDGDVMDINLHTIKVRNFDKTITVIPTYTLIDSSFKNWRGMKETGGRRIKRSIYLDKTSVKFLDEEMLKRFQKFQLIKDYIDKKRVEVDEFNREYKIDTSQLINGRRLTNLGTFRAYLKAYLKNRTDINSNLTFLIRQLSSGPEGIPIEIYVFANTTQWVKYEEIQADIFDHILAVVPLFDLRVFQHPSGYDFQRL